MVHMRASIEDPRWVTEALPMRTGARSSQDKEVGVKERWEVTTFCWGVVVKESCREVVDRG